MQVGDQARLKSGGPVMTVFEIIENRIHCQWFDGAKLKQSDFDRLMLVPHPQPEDYLTLLERDTNELIQQLKEINGTTTK